MAPFNIVGKTVACLYWGNTLTVMLSFNVMRAAIGVVVNQECYTGSVTVSLTSLQFTAHNPDWKYKDGLYSARFNFLSCERACRQTPSFQYMAVAYLPIANVLECKCTADLPRSGHYSGAGAALYCGYRCVGDNTSWCIDRNKQPWSQDRMMVFHLQRLETSSRFTIDSTTTTLNNLGVVNRTSTLPGRSTSPGSTTTPRLGFTTEETTGHGLSYTKNTQENTSSKNSTGLSTPVIAGMAFGVIVGVGLIILGIVVILLIRRSKARGKGEDGENVQDSNQNLYDYADVDKMDTERIDPYEEWGPGSDQPSPTPPFPTKPLAHSGSDGIIPAPVEPLSRPGSDGTPPPPPAPAADTEDVYAQPDMEKKSKARRPDSEAVSIVDNDLYGENAGDDGEENTYYNTANILQPTENNRPDTIFPPKQTDIKKD